MSQLCSTESANFKLTHTNGKKHFPVARWCGGQSYDMRKKAFLEEQSRDQTRLLASFTLTQSPFSCWMGLLSKKQATASILLQLLKNSPRYKFCIVFLCAYNRYKQMRHIFMFCIYKSTLFAISNNRYSTYEQTHFYYLFL